MQQKAVLVTGASSGIGLETALHLASRGFHVYATLREPDRTSPLEEKASRIDGSLSIMTLDITDETSIEAVIGKIASRSGSLYGLVNNAGINIRGFFEDVSPQEMRRVYDVNLFGTMAVTRAVLPLMRPTSCGRIIIMSSVGGKIPTLGNSAYCSTKFALEGFGRTLAQEVRPFGIFVSLIEPGFVSTELFRRNRLIAKGAEDQRSPYRAMFARLEELTDELLRSPVASAHDVAQTIHKALTSRKPNFSYVVGKRTKALLALQRYLPGEVFDQVWMRKTLQQLQRKR